METLLTLRFLRLFRKIYTQTILIQVIRLESLYPNFTYIALKKKKFNTIIHYVDDIFITTQSYNEINELKQTLEKNSEQKKKQNFLNVFTDSRNNDKFITSLYKKSTSYNSTLLNYHSKCPPKYKIAFVKKLTP